MAFISVPSVRTLLAVLTLALVLPLQAQEISDLSFDQQIEMIRSETEAERQLIIIANMTLTEQDSANFWPVYREYRSEAVEISDGIKDLVVRYAEQYQSLSGDSAYSLVAEIFPLQIELARLKQKYLKRFRSVLSPMDAARVMQIENKIDALLLAELALEVPAASSP